MGIALTGLTALIDLHGRYGAFGSTLQVGRQGIFIADNERVAADAAIVARGLGNDLASIVGTDHFADEHLLPRFGAAPVIAADASAYEGAEIVHDFNDPIPERHHRQFDTIIEFGSLEHIFNVPVAIANMMAMLKVGGRILHMWPANNWLGHGFYQLGPELAFRIYQPENGFEFVSARLGVAGQWTDLVDQGPDGIRNERGYTAGTADLAVIAVKTAHVRPFQRWPQQGDYSHAWHRVTGTGAPSSLQEGRGWRFWRRG